MSLSFWLALVALLLLALLFVCYPLIRKPGERSGTVGQPDRRSQNLAAYRSRLEELERERDTGVLEEEDFGKLKDELAASLLEDVGAAEETSAPLPRRGRVFWAVSICALVSVPVLSLVLYEKWGASDELASAKSMTEWRHQMADGETDVPALLRELRNRLEENPENVEGWAMLGRFSMRTQDYDQAALAYRRLAEQVADNPQQAATAWGLAAQARFFRDGSRMTDSVNKAVEEARSRDADETHSLGLLGIHAFQNRNFEDAVTYWSRLLEVAPDHPQRQTIEQGVARAREALGLPVAESSQPSEGSDANVEVELDVSLADSLTEQPAPDDTLFVYAKAAKGRPMPLAITRLKASDLPATVTLTEAMAMSPAATLSSADNVVFVARVSPSGNAMPQSGDWEGTTGPVEVAPDMGTFRIRIDRRLP